jgi:glucose/arabinose dehydrogenase
LLNTFRASLLLTTALLALQACSGADEAENAATPANLTKGPPAETRPIDGVGHKAAFPGQTRAPTISANEKFAVDVVAEGLEMPWAMEFLPDGRLIVTEKGGNFRFVAMDGKISQPGTGHPAVDTEGQGGLLEVALDPDFANNRTIYWTYAEPRQGGNGTAVAKGVLGGAARPELSQVQVIFRQQPTIKSVAHFGSRIDFSRDGKLFVGLGERAIPEARGLSQDLNAHMGKVIRLERDGRVPADNPYVGQSGARPEVWSYGHRNIQAAAINPTTGEFWVVEHGPLGGDELNIARAKRNYGWPIITYGYDYSKKPMGDNITAKEGMEQPTYYWDPNIAPSGLLFYTGDAFPGWKGSAFIGGLSGQKLVRLTLEGDKVVGEEWLLTERENRFRDVKQGPDGNIYVLTEEGQVLRLRPERT